MRGVPLASKVSPTAGTAFAVVLWTNSPVPLMLSVLPPGSVAVPRSSVPPVRAMAASVPPLLSWTVSLRSARLPPVTRIVGASVVVVKITPVTITFPEVTVRAGDWPTKVVDVPLPARVSVTSSGGWAVMSAKDGPFTSTVMVAGAAGAVRPSTAEMAVWRSASVVTMIVGVEVEARSV